MNNQRMRIGPVPPKLEWRTIAVTAKDALAFARDLQTALQELTDGGFTITSQMQRHEGLVIVASRVREAATESRTDVRAHGNRSEAEAIVARATSTFRRRVVEMPAARTHGATTEEVLYHYIEKGDQKQKAFPSLVDALRALKEHLHQDDVVPVNITTTSMTRFEPDSFVLLLKLFAEDLPCPPG
jgi:hypothetical protein